MIGAAVIALALALGGAAAQAADVHDLAAQKSAALAGIHKKASRALVNAAQDEALAAYFLAPAEARPDLKRRIEALTLRVQANMPIAEMCLIDETGQEVARIVGNAVAPVWELRSDEAEAPFFDPGFARSPRQIHIEPLYFSTDANAWAVAYVTPIEAAGRKVAILHYELTLDHFRAVLATDLGAEALLLVTDAEGRILIDSRAPNPRGSQGREPQDRFPRTEPALRAALAGRDQGSAVVELQGRRYSAAFRTVAGWTIVAAVPLE